MNRKLFGTLFILFGLFLSFGTKYIFPVCQSLKDDGTPMRCFYTGNIIIGLGLAIIGFGICHLCFQHATAQIVSAIGIIKTNLLILCTIYSLIGVCKNPTMPCKMQTAPACTIFCVLSIFLAGICIIANIKEWKSSKHENDKDANQSRDID